MGGTTGPASTVTATVSVALFMPTVAVSVNLSVVFAARPVGAVKLGAAVFAPVSVTVGLPPVWLHE